MMDGLMMEMIITQKSLRLNNTRVIINLKINLLTKRYKLLREFINNLLFDNLYKKVLTANITMLGKWYRKKYTQSINSQTCGDFKI